jgi:hypothetical protein
MRQKMAGGNAPMRQIVLVLHADDCADPAALGPFLYYPGHRLVPAPLRAFIDFVKASAG